MMIDGLGEPTEISNQFVEVQSRNATAELTAGPDTDWFNDPSGEYTAMTAPVMWFTAPPGDVAFGATITTSLKSTFDAAGLMIRAGYDWWGKLAYELSPQGCSTVVSVISSPLSDDANGPEAGEGSIQLRVIRKQASVSMFFRSDGDLWQLVRYAALPVEVPIELGLIVQSPTGDGCSATFSSCFLHQNVPEDIRSGD